MSLAAAVRGGLPLDGGIVVSGQDRRHPDTVEALSQLLTDIVVMQRDRHDEWAMRVIEGECPFCRCRLEPLTLFGIMYGAYVKCFECDRCYRAFPHNGRTVLTVLDVEALADRENLAEGGAYTLL